MEEKTKKKCSMRLCLVWVWDGERVGVSFLSLMTVAFLVPCMCVSLVMYEPVASHFFDM